MCLFVLTAVLYSYLVNLQAYVTLVFSHHTSSCGGTQPCPLSSATLTDKACDMLSRDHTRSRGIPACLVLTIWLTLSFPGIYPFQQSPRILSRSLLPLLLSYLILLPTERTRSFLSLSLNRRTARERRQQAPPSYPNSTNIHSNCLAPNVPSPPQTYLTHRPT